MIKKSAINFWKMQGEGAWGIQRLLNMIHGYLYYTIYDHYTTAIVLRITSKFPKFIYKALIVDFSGNHYHSKIITYENAKKLIAIDEEVVLPNEESKKIIPWKIANKIILKHMDHLAIVDCPCRVEKKTAGKKYCEPLNTCIFFGKVGVDFITTHMPRMHGRRVTKEEVFVLLDEQQKQGKVLTIWFKDATGYRAGVMCCCCACCCVGMEAELTGRKKGIQGLKHLAPSGYSVSINSEKCKVCGKCIKLCHFEAMSIVENEGKKKMIYNKDQCMGCGVCVSVCPNEATSLSVDPDKGMIFDVESMVKLYGAQHQAIREDKMG